MKNSLVDVIPKKYFTLIFQIFSIILFANILFYIMIQQGETMLKRTVIIAEGDGITSLDIKTSLKKFNIESEIVKTMNALAEQARLLKPDLIIADWNIEDKQRVMKVLKDIDKNYRIPLILISSSLKSRFEEFSNALTSCTVLAKPFNASELVTLLQRYLF